MKIEIREQAFNPWQELAQYESGDDLRQGSYGACASFVGTMRDFNQGDSVESLYLEYYAGMTEKLLESEAQKIKKNKGLLDFIVLHRVGEIRPNDPIVLVAAWSAHRAAAFGGCRELMEYLKSNATFWKKEVLTNLKSDQNAGTAQKKQRWVDNVSK